MVAWPVSPNMRCGHMCNALGLRFHLTVVRFQAPSNPACAGIATFTCHEPTSVLDLVPGDHVAAAVLAAGAALVQVRPLHSSQLPLPCTLDPVLLALSTGSSFELGYQAARRIILHGLWKTEKLTECGNVKCLERAHDNCKLPRHGRHMMFSHSGRRSAMLHTHPLRLAARALRRPATSH